MLRQRVVSVSCLDPRFGTNPHKNYRLFRFQDLRHLHAVEWRQSGRSIYDLQQRLGHESIKTTEVYLKYLDAEQQSVVKRGSDQDQNQDQRVTLKADTLG